MPRLTRRSGLALATDLVCVLVFAAAGKESHEAADSALVVLAILWPFAVGVLVAHVGLRLAGRSSLTVAGGAVVLVSTYALGMALRAASGRGLATAFLVVALVFLAATLLGWRLVWRLTHRRGTPTPA